MGLNKLLHQHNKSCTEVIIIRYLGVYIAGVSQEGYKGVYTVGVSHAGRG